jgi:hypothetical protein
MRRELVVSSRTKKRTVKLDNNERRKKKTFLLAREARTIQLAFASGSSNKSILHQFLTGATK